MTSPIRFIRSPFYQFYHNYSIIICAPENNSVSFRDSPPITPTDQASLHLDEKNASCMGEQVIQLVDRSENPVIGKNGLPTTLRGAKGGPGDGDGMSWDCQ